MHITRYTDYSLRVLVYLAVQGSHLTTIQDVVHQLNKKGYVTTVRGKNGGIRLKCSPNDIRIGVLIRTMESSMELVECFSPDNHCAISPVCGLNAILTEGLHSFFDTLDQYTLSDVLPDSRKPQLLRILNIFSPANEIK